MKNIKYLVFTLVLFISFICNVMAEACDSDDIARLKEMSYRINYDSNYVGEESPDGNIQSYEISFTGLGKEFYIVDRENTVWFNYDGDKKYVLSGKRVFNIYSSKCYVKLREINVDLLKFNEYSISYCDGYDTDGIELCDPWYQGEVTEKSIQKVIYELEKKQRELDENKSFFNRIFDSLFEKWYFVVGGLLFVCVIAYMIIKKYSERSVLE